MPETLLTIEQVAEQLQVSTRTVRRLMDADQIKGFMVGKRWRFTQSEIDCYLKRQQEVAEQQTDKQKAVRPNVIPPRISLKQKPQNS
jgi:excisionase family DNA binding protein